MSGQNSMGRLDNRFRSDGFGRPRRARLPLKLLAALAVLGGAVWAVPHLPFMHHSSGARVAASGDGQWVTRTVPVQPEATADHQQAASTPAPMPHLAPVAKAVPKAPDSASATQRTIPVKLVHVARNAPAANSSTQASGEPAKATAASGSPMPKPVLATTGKVGATAAAAPKPIKVADTEAAASGTTGSGPATSDTTSLQWKSYHVKKGETLSGLFNRAGVPAKVWIHLLKLGDQVTALRRLSPDHVLRMGTGPSGHLLALNYQISPTKTLKISRKSPAADWQTDVHKAPVTVLVNRVSAVVHHSLLVAAHRAGLTYGQATQLADIFRWQVNLRRDIRPGDRIIALFNHREVKGKSLSPGRIVAAKLVTRQHTWQAFWFDPKHGPSGYFNAEGHSLKAGILRAPIHYQFISSRFSLHRFDPYVHKWQPHYGVDYAADIGTPIEAAANGRIIFRGRQRGYGRVVIIKSFGRWRTYYAHMHRFAKGLHVGSRVHQGEIIGYVGESGWATGPHLHFGIRDGNHWVNPLKAKLPTAHSVPARYRSKFEHRVHELLADIKAPSGKLGIAQHTTHTHAVSDSG